MRVAILASTFALMVGTPAFAQCVYVACGGSQQVQQQPVYQAPAPVQASGYADGYAAGLAARPAPRTVVRTVTRTVVRQPAKQVRRAAPTRSAHASRPATRRHVAPVAKRHVHVARPAPRAVARTATRHVVSRAAPVRHVHRVSTTRSHYHDPIKDRASTYGAAAYGSSATLASNMSRSSSYSSSYTTTAWVGPTSATNQGGQVCGWGARIVTNAQGYAQRQATWVCQCPQGWRPPGY